MTTVTASDSSSFSYGVSDLNTGNIKNQDEKRIGDTVISQYSLLDEVESDGTKQVVEYTSHPHTEFNEVVRKEPAYEGAYDGIGSLSCTYSHGHVGSLSPGYDNVPVEYETQNGEISTFPTLATGLTAPLVSSYSTYGIPLADNPLSGYYVLRSYGSGGVSPLNGGWSSPPPGGLASPLHSGMELPFSGALESPLYGGISSSLYGGYGSPRLYGHGALGNLRTQALP